MKFLRDRSIRQKLIRVIMLTSVSSIGLTCLAFVAYELTSSRGQVERELTSVAHVIGANTTAALSFDDARAVNDTLNALSAEPSIVGARVFDREGRPFADYRPAGAEVQLPASPTGADLPTWGGHVAVMRRIILHDDLLGSIYIEADARDIRARLSRYMGIALAVLAAASTLAFLLSAVLQGVISRPLLALASTAERVATRRDYLIRAVKESDDEIGQVVDRFNQMLAQIQERDVALRDAQRVLETRVDERTRALKDKIDEQRLTESELVIARDAAEAASRAKSAFLATMSHELRTPLNAIIGYGELMQEEAVDAGHDGYVADLGKITSAGRHLLSLINDILDLSKIEAGRMELSLESVDLGKLLHDVVSSVRPLIDRNANALTMEVESGPATIRADAMRVRQTLLNLVSNAAKFTERGTIDIRLRRTFTDGEWALIEIRDSGIGISPEEMSRLFREFTQADASTTTRKYGGSGLGLAISQRLCRMMGGEITVQSKKGHGSTFTIALPVNGPQSVSGSDLPSSAEEALHV